MWEWSVESALRLPFRAKVEKVQAERLFPVKVSVEVDSAIVRLVRFAKGRSSVTVASASAVSVTEVTLPQKGLTVFSFISFHVRADQLAFPETVA